MKRIIPYSELDGKHSDIDLKAVELVCASNYHLLVIVPLDADDA